MFRLLLLLVASLLCCQVDALNATHRNQGKSKRAPTDDFQNYGEEKPVVLFVDNMASGTSNSPNIQQSATPNVLRNPYAQSKPLALVSLQQPIQVFEQGSPKQVAAQQVLYEFQQTPTNAVSNVHVKQLFQPPGTPSQPSAQGSAQIQSIRQPQAPGYSLSSESMVSPVHHNTFTNHQQNAALLNYQQPYSIPSQPLHQLHSSQAVPGKYLYLNGKIVYQPNQASSTNINLQNLPQTFNHGINQQTSPTAFYQNSLNSPYNQFLQKQPIVNYQNRHFPRFNAASHAGLSPKLTPPTNLPPVTYNRFKPPTKMQPITKPSPVEEKPEEAEEKEEKEEKEEESEERPSRVQEEESEDEELEDDDEIPSFFREEDDNDEEGSSYFTRHSYDDDDDDHHGGRQEDDDDYEREPSKHVSQRYKNKRPENYDYEKGNNNKWNQGFSTESNYESPKGKKSNKSNKKPKGQFKTVKYSSSNGRKPKIETIEGRFSEHVPVRHTQKLIKHKWFITKRSDDE